jgi:transcriptional regulator with XRE-family HTH domain
MMIYLPIDGVNFMGLGETMQRLREKVGLSQAGLAEKSGLSLRSIQNWEQGHRAPSAKALLALAKVLKVPVEKLIGEIDQPDKTPARRGRPKKRK